VFEPFEHAALAGYFLLPGPIVASAFPWKALWPPPGGMKNELFYGL
jgi:hypothetical protein